MITPERWHLYIVDLEPRIGSKPGKQRTCLCIQPSEFCEAGINSAVVLPLTTKIIKKDAFPLRVRVRVRVNSGTCRLLKDSDILVDQILAWDISLFRDDLGLIPEGMQEIVKSAVRDFLDL